MNELLYKKLDELLNTIDNNKKVIRMKKIKEEIYKDKNLKIKLDEYKKECENLYSSKYVKLKKELLDNELIKEYRILENELYFTVLEINKNLNQVIKEGS